MTYNYFSWGKEKGNIANISHYMYLQRNIQNDRARWSLFDKNTFNVSSALRHWASRRFTIQTFMNMVCEGILCHSFTAQGTLYSEW